MEYIIVNNVFVGAYDKRLGTSGLEAETEVDEVVLYLANFSSHFLTFLSYL